jgi:MFS superfamily sulfate permease-like transporter
MEIFIGIIVGICIGRFIFSRKSIGTLRVRTDADGDAYLFLELERNKTNQIQKHKYVSLRVDLDSTPHN